jgi:hypothetical protein
MEALYLYCAVIAGTLLVLQVVLSLIGLGEHFHFDHLDHVPDPHIDIGAHEVGGNGDGFDHGGGRFVGLFSFRALVAAFTVFGLAGLAGQQVFGSSIQTFVAAVAAGGGVMYLVAALLRQLMRLHSEGTADIESAVGEPASVYLSVPGHNSGMGKVTVRLEGQTVEYHAVTSSAQNLPTGTTVVVTGVAGPGVVEVAIPVEQHVPGESNVRA